MVKQKRRLSSKQLVADIRAGLDAEALREKYQLSEKALSQFLKELLLRGLIEPSELRERGLDLEAAMATLRTCPACGWEYAGESDDCPKCGVVGSRFHAIKERERQPSKFRRFVRKLAIGAAVVVVLVIAGTLIWVLVMSPRVAGVAPSEPVSSVPPGPPTELDPQLIEAAKIGDIQKVRSLLKQGANVNAMPGDWTPLMWAVERDNLELAQLLLKKGAQVNAMSAQRNCCKTALMIACTRDDPRVLELLLKNGADVNAREGCCDKWTALLHACRNGRERAVKRLLEAGAGVNIPNNDGDTPLMMASRSGCGVCARLLLDGGANVNSRNEDNWTALMSACYHGNPKVATLLLGRGADARARNDSGATALSMAERHCHECAQLLKKHLARK